MVGQVVANGWGHVNLGKVAVASATSVVTSWAGGQLSGVIAPHISGFTSKIASPVLQKALSEGINNIAPGFVIGSGMSLIGGGSLSDALGQGLSGAAMGFTTGTVTGAVDGAQYAKQNKLDLWSGKSTVPPTAPQQLPPAQSVGVPQAQPPAANPIRLDAANLEEQLVLDQAKTGAGIEIMKGKIKDPKYQGWQKIQYNHELPDGLGTISIHYWKNPATGQMKEFKFKNQIFIKK